ncbi:MAG: hypothetical protein J1E84_02040 [Muribaculaceae bacterium]|nr:hypothetical protein [Muribaculaceae bacterium]
MTNFLIWILAPLVYGVISAGVYTWVRPEGEKSKRVYCLNFIKFTAVAYFILLFLWWMLT